MIINEILNSNHEVKIIRNASSAFTTKIVIGGREIVFDARHSPSNINWVVSFSEIKLGGHEDSGTHKKTQSGFEFEVFSSIKTSLDLFIKTKNPEEFSFSASKHDDGKLNRSSLYKKFVKRFPIKGYSYEIIDENYNDTFYFTKKSQVNEILNTKVDYDVARASRSTFLVKGQIGPRQIEVEISDANGDDHWEISFGEIKTNGRKTYDLTNNGKEFEVFALVKSAIEEFIQRYTPEFLYFTSENEEGNTRTKTYERLINKFKIPGYVRDDAAVHHEGADQHKTFGFRRHTANTKFEDKMRFTSFKNKALVESETIGKVTEVESIDYQVFAEEAFKQGFPDKISFKYKFPSGKSYMLRYEQDDCEVYGRPSKQKVQFTYSFVRGIVADLDNILNSIEPTSEDYAYYDEIDSKTSFTAIVNFKPGRVEINGDI